MTDKQSISWQAWMQNALVMPSLVDSRDVEILFNTGAQLNSAQCLAIYQRGYILRLTKCLSEQFPALCHALGESLFNQFASKYLQQFPSDSYTLYELGRRFAHFLQQDRPDRELPPDQQESWIDFMVDLAQYERLHFKLFDAHGNEGKPWPTTQESDDNLKLQPCFALAQYRYPVAWYYHAIKDDPKVGFPPKQDHYVVLARKDYKVTTYPINPVHYYFLQQLQKGCGIKEALIAVSEMTQAPVEDVQSSWLQDVRKKWIEAGFFVM